MIIYIVVSIIVVLAIVNIIAIRGAHDFDTTGYNPHCFECNKTSCEGCKYK